MNFKTYLNHSGLEYKEYQNDGVNWCIEREKKMQNIVQVE